LPENNLDRELYEKAAEIRAASEKLSGKKNIAKSFESRQSQANLKLTKKLPLIFVVLKYCSVLLIVYAIYGLINGRIFGGYRTIRHEYIEYSHLVAIYYILLSVSVLIATSKTISKIGTNKQRQIVASICFIIGTLLFFYSLPE
jgi:hypothetical protein